MTNPQRRVIEAIQTARLARVNWEMGVVMVLDQNGGTETRQLQRRAEIVSEQIASLVTDMEALLP